MSGDGDLLCRGQVAADGNLGGILLDGRSTSEVPAGGVVGRHSVGGGDEDLEELGTGGAAGYLGGCGDEDLEGLMLSSREELGTGDASGYLGGDV